MFTILPSSASRLDLYNTGQILYNLIGVSAAGVTSVSVTGHSSQSGNLNFSGIGSVTVSTGVGNFIYFSGSATSSSADHNDGINLSGNLQVTGQNILSYIVGLSGLFSGNIQSTGQQSWMAANNNSINLSGNLQLTGSNLQTAINLISGNYLTGIHSGNYIPKYVINGNGFDESIIYQSGNKIGIGATGFLSNIVTVSSSTSIDGIRINNLNGGGSAQAAISFSYDSSSLSRSRIGYFPATNELRIAGGGDNLGFVSFYAGGAGDVTTATEKMRIQPGGSVGINTNSPLSNSKLDVSGNIYGSGINANSSLTISGQSVITGSQICLPLSSSSITVVNMPDTLNFFDSSNINSITYIDLSTFSQVMLTSRVSTIGTSTGYLYLGYLGNFSTTQSNYMFIDSNNTKTRFETAGVTNSGWQPLTAGARSGVYVALLQSGGNGVLSPVFGKINAFFR